MNSTLARILRVVAVVLMALTATLNLLGATGTVCAAFLTDRFPSMSPLLKYAWLYQVLMIATLVLGILGVWLSVALARRSRIAIRRSLMVLAAGTLLAAIHVAASLALRGKAVPANIKLVLNALTLAYFLCLQIPVVRRGITEQLQPDRFSPPGAGLAALVSGVAVLTTPWWVGASHIYAGQSWVLWYGEPLLAAGLALSLCGIALLGRRAVRARPAAGIQPA